MKKGKKILASLFIIFLGLSFIGVAIGPAFLSGGISTSPLSEPEGPAFAPDFTLPGLDGTDITLSDYRGDKPVILDFFSTQCLSCQRDIPQEAEFYEKYDRQVEVIGINLQENKKIVEDFVAENDIPFPVVLDPLESVANLYYVTEANYHVLIGRDGTLVGVVPGDIKESDFTDLLNT